MLLMIHQLSLRCLPAIQTSLPSLALHIPIVGEEAEVLQGDLETAEPVVVADVEVRSVLVATEQADTNSVLNVVNRTATVPVRFNLIRLASS